MSESVADIKRAPAGQRFYARYRRFRARGKESYVATVFYVAVGALAVMLGIVFSFWPIIPGFVFVLAGMALLSARSVWIARTLDRLELAVRRVLPGRWGGKSAG